VLSHRFDVRSWKTHLLRSLLRTVDSRLRGAKILKVKDVSRRERGGHEAQFAKPHDGAYSILSMSTVIRRRGVRVPESPTPQLRTMGVSKGEAKASRVLAVDYGRKRIGLALSDESGLTAEPLAVVCRINRRKDLQQLREICREHNVSHVIVGQPLRLSGELSEMAIEAKAFAKRLAGAVDLTVELVDERLTSWEARQTMARIKPAARRKGEPLDHVAAAVLLRDYLGRKRSEANSNITETNQE
jgi:putative holliday junction resolvase